MSYHGETRIFYIDSFFRVSGSNTDFSINLDLPRNDYNRVALIQFSCAKSYYNFPEGRNTFTLEENGILTLITIPPGNYSVSSLIVIRSEEHTSELQSRLHLVCRLLL